MQANLEAAKLRRLLACLQVKAFFLALCFLRQMQTANVTEGNPLDFSQLHKLLKRTSALQARRQTSLPPKTEERHQEEVLKIQVRCCFCKTELLRSSAIKILSRKAIKVDTICCLREASCIDSKGTRSCTPSIQAQMQVASPQHRAAILRSQVAIPPQHPHQSPVG